MGKKTKVKKEDKEISIYIFAALFLLFIVLFYIVQPSTEPLGMSENKTKENEFIAPRNMTGIDEFAETLIHTEKLAIVMNVTGITMEQARYVYTCGAGLAGSWGKAGRNITNLYIYVIEGENCTTSKPGETDVNATIVKPTQECIEEFEKIPRFYIRYGPSYSTFTNETASIFVDETFEFECSFELKQSGNNEEIN